MNATRELHRQKQMELVVWLEILQNLPCFIPFETREQIFREFIEREIKRRHGPVDADAWRMAMNVMQPPEQIARHHASIR